MEWKYKIGIKDMFNNDESFEHINNICISLVRQLYKVNKMLIKSNLVDRVDLTEELTEIIDHFNFVRDFADGTIEESEYDEFSFDGDLVTLLNDYMEQLFDFGDQKVATSQRVIEKLLWVGE